MTSHLTPPKNFILSLSGGGASSLAYAGFLDILAENNLQPDAYAGLSGGSLMAILFASGYTSAQCVDFINHIDLKKLFNYTLHHLEILNHQKLTEVLRDMLPYKTFESLPRKAYIFSSNLTNYSAELLSTGDIASAVVASCSVFPLLAPAHRRGEVLGDGGFTVYYGAKYLRDAGYKIVVGVDVIGLTEKSVSGFFKSMYKLINTSINHNAAYELANYPVDVDVRISTHPTSIFGLKNHTDYLLSLGRLAAKKHIHSIKKNLIHS